MKKISILLVFVLVFMTVPALSFAAENIVVTVDGMSVMFDEAKPYLDNNAGRVFVPVRAISENLNMRVGWDSHNQRVTIEGDSGIFIVMQIDNTTAYVNGEEAYLDYPPTIQSQRTYLPLRFVSENLGCDVEWVEADRRVVINRSDSRFQPETLAKTNEILQNITGAEDFTTEEPIDNGIEVSVGDFGASPNAEPEENVKAFEQAIQKVKEINATKLIIPTGVYYFRAEKNNQIEINGLTDLLVDGMGSELIFKDHSNSRSGAFIRIENCERVKLYNMTLDWDFEETPLNFLGKVSAVDFGQNRVEFTTDGTKVPEKFTFDLGQEWDGEVNNKVPHPSYSFPVGDIVSSEKVADDKFALTLTNSNSFANVNVDDPVYLRFKSNYNANAINAHASKNIILNEITVHSVPYQVCYMSVVENLEYNNIKVVPKDNRRFTGFGGLETHQVIKNIKLVDSVLDGIYDDFMHMSNSFFAAGAIKEDDYTVILDKLQHYASVDYIYNGADFIMKTVEFEDIEWESTIVDFEWQLNYYPGASAAHRCVVKFKDPLPEDFKTDNIFFNKDFAGGNYIIRNNIMKNGSCHALYFGLGNGIIENNTFENFAYPTVVLNTVMRWGRWAIGYDTSNVIIRNNTMKGGNYAHRDPATFFVGGGFDEQPSNYRPVKGRVTRNVLVDNNVIEDSIWAAFGVFSAENVVIRNNKIINSNLRESRAKFAGMGNVYIYDADNIVFAGNTNSNTKNVFEEGFFVDEFTTTNVVIDENPGFGDVITMRSRIDNIGQHISIDGAIVVHTESFGYEEFSGSWSNSVAKGYESVQTRQSSSANAQVRFKPMLDGGKYRISVYKVTGTPADTATLVTVSHKDGISEYNLDASQGSSGFVEIGEFEFNEGLEGYVSMTRGENTVRISAAKFEKID